MALMIQAPAASPSTFVGTWVGFQTWTGENISVSAKTPQQVTLTIDMVDGKLTGSMPFFGGTDEATFLDSKIVGDELEATAVIKKAAAAQQRRAWTDDVKITFRLKADKTNMTGTADVLMGAVPRMKFKYELGKKRSIY
jgi:hypothetical protein